MPTPTRQLNGTARLTARVALIAGLALSSAATIHADVDLPVRRITLYRSGVGYFEHSDTVDGTDIASLRFETAEINDLLKSMIVFDYGGGKISGVEYEPKEPLSQKLKQFSFSLEDSIVSLLKQFRGERIRIRTPQGDVEGTIFGAEQRLTTLGGAGENPGSVVQDWFITVVTGTGIRALAQSEILSFELLDDELADELNRALATIADHRSDDLTEIHLTFTGEGQRDIAVAYTLEAPVWKTSYRLVLPEETAGRPVMQGWAIVENDTESDWERVELSLAAGRPISFTMDLQTPFHLLRPNVGVPVISNLPPVVYESGMRQLATANAPMPASEMEEFRSRREGLSKQAAGDYAADADMLGRLSGAGLPTTSDFQQYWSGGQAMAGEAGEQFLYTLEAPVSIKRGGSSMLPILQSDIEGRRVSIYQSGAQHAMRGVEMTNDTGLHLMPGPIAVYDGGRYAGDAQIRHTSRNQQRLLSYAVDSELHVETDTSSVSRVQNVTIVNGLLRRQSKVRQTTTYKFENFDSSRGRTMLIEHPKSHGWELIDTVAPIEETEHAHRFEIGVEPGQPQEFRVQIERVEYTSIGITDMPTKTLMMHLRNGRVSQAVVDAVTRAVGMQAQINRLNTRIQELEKERGRTFEDQERLRRNMNTVGKNSQLWARYAAKLAEQETRLEQILVDLDNAQTERERVQRQLNEYLQNLSVE